MPQAEQIKPTITFNRGLITEATELSFPVDATTDESNCELFLKGNRRRRYGIDFETSYSLSTINVPVSTYRPSDIGTFTWEAVGGDGDTNFLAVQLGSTIHFYDLGNNILSNGKKSFTIDLTSYSAPAATAINEAHVQMASGKGFLFIAGPKTKPIYVEYDSVGDSITVTEASLEIRDFDGVDDTLGITEEPATLSTEHSYNLKNQGWNSPGAGEADPVATYFTSKSKYPPNSKQWWAGKNSSEVFDPNLLTKMDFGNTLAPRGHFILDPFNKDRDTASGLSGITTDTEAQRPSSIAFYAGRVWYAGVAAGKLNSHVFYSQIVEDTSKIGRCYQDADPTSENIFDLVDTDGGVVVVPEIGNVLSLFIMGDFLVLFADNGVWSIAGSSNAGFKATDYAVNKITSIGAMEFASIVDVEGAPVWWSETGIYTLQADQISGRLIAKNLTEKTIQTFYNSIPPLSKVSTKGIYDKVNHKVRWLYKSTGVDTNFHYEFDRVLTMDTVLGSFYPFKISSLASDSPYIVSAFTTPAVNTLVEIGRVVDGANTVVDGANAVVTNVASLQGANTFVRYLVSVPNSGSTLYNITFGDFENTSFLDWEKADSTGVDYVSFLESGYEMMGDAARNKQAPYVVSHFKATETSYTLNTDTFENPSSCYLQSKWNWADSTASSKWSTKQQAYRLNSTQKPTADENPLDQGWTVVSTKNKIRGSGYAMQLRWESEAGKDFDLLGWATQFTGNTRL